MKILVPLKRVPDPDTKIRIKPDGSGVDFDGVKFAVNPFDAIALEEALRLKEKLGEIEIVVVSIGGEECIEQLRVGLAMGADRALLVKLVAQASSLSPSASATGETPVLRDLDSLVVAKILAAVYHREKPDFVLMGKQAIDDDSNQAGQMVAALLGIGQATFVSKLELLDKAGAVVAQASSLSAPTTETGKMPVLLRCGRETDAGIETITVKLPAVITTDLRLNEPRYVSLPGIMKAKKKPLEEIALADLGVAAASRTTVLKLEYPPKRKAGVQVKTVDELIEKLKNEAKVI